LADHWPKNWISHITVKQMHFEAAAQYRMSQEELEKSRYGTEVSRLKVAEGLAKKGLDVGKKNVAEAVVSDLRVNTSTSLLHMTDKRRCYKQQSNPLSSVLSGIMTSSILRPSRLPLSSHRSWAPGWSSWSRPKRLPSLWRG